MDDANPWTIVADVARVLEALGLRYAVGGSLASSVAGEPRSTQDADISVDLRPEHVDALLDGLSARFYVPAERLRRAASERLSVNIIHLDTAMKVDLFVAGGTPIDEEVLRRRVPFSPPSATHVLYIYTPEDVLLHKLRRYEHAGATSDAPVARHRRHHSSPGTGARSRLPPPIGRHARRIRAAHARVC